MLNRFPLSVKIKSGLAANINTTATKNAAVTGELHFCTDTKELFVFDGVNMAQVGSIINEGGADQDYRVEGDTEPYMIYLDASTDTLYLGGLTNGIKIEKGGVMKTVGRQQAVRTVTAATTMTVSDEVIEFNSATAITQTLIAATGTGARYSLINIGAGRVTLDGATTDTIDGELTQYIDTDDAITIHDVATGKWRVC